MNPVHRIGVRLSLVMFMLVLSGQAMGQIVPRIGPNKSAANLVLPPSLDDMARPALAELDIDGVKHFAVAWQQNEVGVVPGIYLALIDIQGNVAAGPGQILDPALAPTSTRIGNPTIAADRNGNFAVAWTVLRIDGGNGTFTREIQYQMFEPMPSSGGGLVPRGDVTVLVNADADLGFNPGSDALAGRYENIDLAASAFGRYALAFSDYRASGNWGVYLSLFDFDVDDTTDPMNPVFSLQPVTNPIQIANNGEFRVSPRVDINPNSERTVVVWRSTQGAIYAQRFTALGVPEGSRIEVQPPTESVQLNNYDPDVAIDPNNSFWITWEQNVYQGGGNPRAVGLILISRYDSNGNVILSSVNAPTEAPPAGGDALIPKRFPRIRATDTAGNVAVTWQQADDICTGGFVNSLLDVTSSGCPLTVQNCGPLCFDASLSVPPAGGACNVDFKYSSQTGAQCRQRTKVEPYGVDQSAGWISYADDFPREFFGGVNESHTVTLTRGANSSPTLNRCAELQFSGVSSFASLNRIRIEQRCAQDNGNCVSCDDQLGSKPPAQSAKAGFTDLAELPGMGADQFPGMTKDGGTPTYDVHMRYLHNSFLGDEATLTPQFRVNDFSSGNQAYPVLGMFRNGEMLVSWAGAFDAMSPDSLIHQRYTSPVLLTINDVGILEGELGRATASFTVGVSKPYPDPLTGDPIPVPMVEVLTADGTATFLGDDPDYERLSMDLEFLPGAPVAQPVDVEVLDDFIYEDTESYFVDLLNESNAVVSRRKGIGAIIDNDPPATVEVLDIVICEDGEQPLPPVPPSTEPSCDESSMLNPNATVTLTVQIFPAQQVDGSVEFQTADGITAGGSVAAIAGQDYEAVIGELQFLTGAPTQAFVTIDLKDNLLQENNKNFRVQLTDATDLTLGMDVTGVVTILNDDTCAELPTAMPASGQPQPAELPIDGGTGYICVTNNNPMDCPWISRLDFVQGAPNDWITATDFPQAADVGTVCGNVAGATGYIRFEADANMPPMPNQPNLARTVGLSFLQGELDPPVFQISQAGGECALEASEALFNFYPVEGQGSFDVSFNEPPGSPGICDTVGWEISVSGGANWIGSFRIDGNPGTSSTGPRQVTFEVMPNPAPNPLRQGFVVVSGTLVEVNQEGAFFDHFDDGILPSYWNFADISNWSEAGTWMTGVTAGGQQEQAIANPAFPGCLDCEIVSAMRMDTFGKGRAILYAWYQDDQNHVALSMDEFADTFTLSQVVNGTSQIVKVFDTDILVGSEYDITLAYDDSITPLFLLSIDGQAACPPVDAGQPICEPVVTPSNATVGFAVDSATASFNLIQVTRSDGAAFPSETIFEDGLEGQTR